ncbi:amidohydrolase family protein [Sphingomonas sp. BIUV-7]|uniref:Amidohydrolase family protein n=1 Tax=Sphingomonas natans TaxID=3063330 RepID=A0ABT8Y6Z9_9SPHN|nr:amidohydrolase family protein [Sphingomonas sp. BIUV-7]MDO6414079.1 amidohydrolase family protein [Sphingomonas sp. BIUV-7]
MNISLFLQMAADTDADRIALVCDGRRWSYAALHRSAQGAARSIRESGATHVALLDEGSEASAIALFGAAIAGIPYVPLNYRLADADLGALLGRIAPAFVIGDVDRVRRLSPDAGHIARTRADFVAEAEAKAEGPEPDETDETIAIQLFTMAHLPLWDKAALDKEARRCIDMGLKGFVLPDTPERVGVPSYMRDYWDDFLDLCSATGTPINFHLNAAMDPTTLTWDGFVFEQTLSVVATMFSIGNVATLGNWMVSGRLDKHPGLKIGLIESGMGWIPFAVEALEHQFQEMLPHRAGGVLKKAPWDYFRDHFFGTFWFETIGPQLLLETIGFDNMMFETDFPHPTSLYPGVQEHIQKALGGYDYAVKKKILETNAVRMYNLPF